MRTLWLIVVLSLALPAPWAHADQGLILKRSPHSVAATLDRLEAVLKEKGMKIVARVPHSRAAAGAGIDLRPTELLIFGNPKIGSQLMTSNQTVAIDLPMKALAWQDESGQVWLAYNDPAYLAERHHVTGRSEVLAKMAQALAMFTDRAVQPGP